MARPGGLNTCVATGSGRRLATAGPAFPTLRPGGGVGTAGPAFATLGAEGGFVSAGLSSSAARRALRDALTLGHLHPAGVDCASAEESRGPWRRWFHHCTFYGFMPCFAFTSVAAIYDGVFGWSAPYGYTSLPVLIGTVGGLGLLVGPAGLLALGRRRDPALGDAAQNGLDESFIALLFVTTSPVWRCSCCGTRRRWARCSSSTWGPCWRSSSRSRTASSCTASTARLHC